MTADQAPVCTCVEDVVCGACMTGAITPGATAPTDDDPCPADHAHGESPTCYLRHRCRCADCRAGQARRQADRRRAIAYGTYTAGFVSADPVRAHLDALRGAGMGLRTISAVSGVSGSTLSNIVWGATGPDGIRRRRQHVSQRIAGRILDVRPRLEVMADGASVDGRGTRRRLQALACLGWSGAELSRRLGLPEYRLQRVTHADRVLASTARRVAALYAEMWGQRPTAESATAAEMIARTIRAARAAGWVPPLGWDDIDEDAEPVAVEADTEIDTIAVELAVAGTRVSLTIDERHEVVRQLNARGYSDSTIAAMAGVSAKTVERDRKQLGIPAVEENISRKADAA